MSASPPVSVVAGGAGFVGSHLCDRLLADGHRVICVDNLLTGRRDNVAHLADEPRFTFVDQDISEPFTLDGPIDHVLNLASPASPIDYAKLPLETLRVGAFGTQHTLELARANGARYLLASTSEVYGDPEEHPQRESYWGHVNPIGPRSCYDEAKRFAEAMVMAYRRTYGMETRIVRIFNTYGPRMRAEDGRVVPAFIQQALTGKPLTVFGEGQQTRAFCYVSDLVDGIVRLLHSDETEPVNIGNPAEMTILAFAQTVIALTDAGSTMVYKPLPEDDPKTRRPDIGRARAVLDWQPTVDLETGLARTIDDFRHRLEARDAAADDPAADRAVATADRSGDV
ncbi:MAG: UDP-glucuronic acid decarboxylase family protein [Acidobacteriota bacterium]